MLGSGITTTLWRVKILKCLRVVQCRPPPHCLQLHHHQHQHQPQHHHQCHKHLPHERCGRPGANNRKCLHFRVGSNFLEASCWLSRRFFFLERPTVDDLPEGWEQHLSSKHGKLLCGRHWTSRTWNLELAQQLWDSKIWTSAKVLLHPHSHTRNYLDTSIESFSFDSKSWVGTLWIFQISRKVLPEEFPNRWDQMGLKMLIQKTMPPLPLAKQLHCEAKRMALFSGCAETRRECRRYGGIVGIHSTLPCSPLQFSFFKTESFESDSIDLNDWTSPSR